MSHVATLIAGKGKSSERDVNIVQNGRSRRAKLALYGGLAPKARIISLKVLDGNGAGYTSSVLRALEFAVANREKLKIDIVNLSLGHPIYEPAATDPLVQAVEAAVRAGIVAEAGCDLFEFCKSHDAQVEAIEALVRACESGEVPWKEQEAAEARVMLDRFRSERLPAKWRGVFEARFIRQLDQRSAAKELKMFRTTLAYQELRVRALLRKFLLRREG